MNNPEHFCLQRLPLDCRLHVLEFLSPTDLYARYGTASRTCHQDSMSEKLPQTTWGTFFVSSKVKVGSVEDGDGKMEISLGYLLEKICHPSFRRAWGSPRSHMRIVGHEEHGVVHKATMDDLSFEDIQERLSGLSFESVTSLDISLRDEMNEGFPRFCGERDLASSSAISERVLPRSLPWLLSRILPCLIELDLSNLHGGPIEEGDYVSELSLFNSNSCPNLSTVRWNNRIGGCTFLRGKDMRTLDNLKELHLDNILCDWRFDGQFAPITFQFFEEQSEIQRFFFFACNKSLERVSLLDGKYVTMGPLRVTMEFPQWALIKFVRGTPNLKWFRSSLSPENVELLSKDRPEIHFCNGREVT